MKQNSLNIFRDNFNKTFKQSVDVVKSPTSPWPSEKPWSWAVKEPRMS